MGIGTVIDVICSALSAQLRYGNPAVVLGLALMLITMGISIFNSFTPLSPTAYAGFFWIYQAMIAVAGLCETLRNRPFRVALSRAMVSSLMGLTFEFVVSLLWLVGAVTPSILRLNSGYAIHGYSLTLFWVRSEAPPGPVGYMLLLAIAGLLQGGLCGFIGVSLGKIVRRAVRSEIRK